MSKKSDKKEPAKAPGIGQIAIAAILEGKTNDEVLAAVKKAHPDSRTTMSSINWYRQQQRALGAKVKGTGKPVPTSREQKAKAAEGKPKAKAKAKVSGKKDDPLS